MNINEKIIKKEIGNLKNKRTLFLFTDFNTNKNHDIKRSIESEKLLKILKNIEELSNGKLTIEEFSIEENRDEIKKYDIITIPTIIFQTEDNYKEMIRFTTNLEGNQLIPFLKTVQYYSGINPFYKDQIITNLKNIEESSLILFITQSCPYCPQVIPIVNSFAIISNGKIRVEIIDINLHPYIAEKYNISGVPHLIINKKYHLYGSFSPQDLLDKLTMGRRDFSGMYS